MPVPIHREGRGSVQLSERVPSPEYSGQAIPHKSFEAIRGFFCFNSI